MKRFVLALGIILALALPAMADHSGKNFGVGIVAGGGVAGNDIGLALKLPSTPIFWGIHLNLNTLGLGLGATGDYYFVDEGLVQEGSFNLDWFLGLGGYLSLGFWSTGVYTNLGARLPVGLSWHITKQFELWVDIAPSLGLAVNPLQFPAWDVSGEVGFRAWLK